MANRVTEKQLDEQAHTLNIVAGFPTEPNEPGHLFVQGTIAGYQLKQTVNRSGAARDALDTGPVTKRELNAAMKAYGRGVAAGIDRGRELYEAGAFGEPAQQ